MTRTAIVAWLLAVSCMVSRAAEQIQYMNVTVGQDVMLPCPCSEDTNKLVWQIGEEIVVNHCCGEDYPLHKSYVNRTQVFLSSTKGNCSLLLRNVSLEDERIFTCYVLKFLNMYKVGLTVGLEKGGHTSSRNDHPTTENPNEPQTGFLVGIPLSLILVILVGLIVMLLIRKHQQRRPRLVVIQDLQAKLPIMTHSPV